MLTDGSNQQSAISIQQSADTPARVILATLIADR